MRRKEAWIGEGLSEGSQVFKSLKEDVNKDKAYQGIKNKIRVYTYIGIYRYM